MTAPAPSNKVPTAITSFFIVELSVGQAFPNKTAIPLSGGTPPISSNPAEAFYSMADPSRHRLWRRWGGAPPRGGGGVFVVGVFFPPPPAPPAPRSPPRGGGPTPPRPPRPFA